MAEREEPYRELFKVEVAFNLGLEHQFPFDQMKKVFASSPILAYYNPSKQTVLQTDASVKVLGACLLQKEKLFYFASKALSDAQKGYVTIELETLAVAWAMEKFHHFLYASHFILETDQKPLEVILTKSIKQAMAMLQRILISTFPYHFTVCYIPGLTNQLAHSLSRLGGQEDTIKLPKLHLYQITNQLCARSDSLNQLKLAMQEDESLHCSNIPSHKAGQAQSKKSPAHMALLDIP